MARAHKIATYELRKVGACQSKIYGLKKESGNQVIEELASPRVIGMVLQWKTVSMLQPSQLTKALRSNLVVSNAKLNP